MVPATGSSINGVGALQQTLTSAVRLLLLLGALLSSLSSGCAASLGAGSETDDPERVIRLLVQANADRDIETLSRFMAHDADIVSYTVGGRKFVGWDGFEREMKDEFGAVAKLDIPITELKVWKNGETAWFAMEVDYVRYVGSGAAQTRTVLPLRETGVLERRGGRWVLLSWHESFRTVRSISPMASATHEVAFLTASGGDSPTASATYDLKGEWEIIELVGKDEDKRYKAALDRNGNGPYTQQGGQFVTTNFSDRRWEGTWQQTGNDREGGFELLLSEDGTRAEGIWWYTRVGTRTGIPPREHGGNYVWKRLSRPDTAKTTQ